MEKAREPVKLTPHFLVSLVTGRFRRAGNIGKWWTFQLSEEDKFKINKCDISSYLSKWWLCDKNILKTFLMESS